MPDFQSRTLLQIRQSVGRNTGAVIVGAASALGATTSLIDTYGMAKGGDNEYKGRQVLITSTVTGGAAVGQKSFVASSDGTTKTATLSPAVNAEIKAAQAYEMWQGLTVEDVQNFINEAIQDASGLMYVDKDDVTLTSVAGTYEYSVPAGFVAIHTIEYLSGSVYYPLRSGEWDILRASGKIVLTPGGLSVSGATTLRLRGYEMPSLMAADEDVADIDPAYVIAAATAKALASNLVTPELDTKARTTRLGYWQGVADRLKKERETAVMPGTRWL